MGTDDGLIHVTRDGGKTWKNVTPPELTPWSKVSQLDASYFDNDTVYASINRFRLDDLQPYIYRTHDGGKTWKKIVDGIPDERSRSTPCAKIRCARACCSPARSAPFTFPSTTATIGRRCA